MTTESNLACFAIALEERGEDFYRRAAETVALPAVKATFLRLAEDERDHAHHFRVLVKPSAPAPGPEVEAYLQAVLSDPGGLFPTAARAAAAGDPQAAIALAIQAEKDSILLYQELYTLAGTEEERTSLGQILKAEKLHLLELQDLLHDEG